MSNKAVDGGFNLHFIRFANEIIVPLRPAAAGGAHLRCIYVGLNLTIHPPPSQKPSPNGLGLAVLRYMYVLSALFRCICERNQNPDRLSIISSGTLSTKLEKITPSSLS